MKRFGRFVLAMIAVVGITSTTACKESTGPDVDIDAAWMQEPPALYVYGYTGAQVMWTFFEANTPTAPKINFKILGGSSIKLVDTPTQPVYLVSTERTRFRTDVVFTTVGTGITCFQLQILRGPTTERCVSVNLSEKGNLQITPI
jgi:hypothetical protein